MFVEDDTKTIFQVMYDFDCSAFDAYERVKDLRNGVNYYNAKAGTSHEFNSELLSHYWNYCKALSQKINF